jgi:LEA14-like dessication related protein
LSQHLRYVIEKSYLLNPKIIVGGVVAAFVIVIGIIGFSGSVIIDDVTGGNVVSPAQTPREALPLEVDLEDISILEVNERAATIEIQFKVTNPNVKSVILQFIKYEIYENNIRIHIGQIGERPLGMVESSNYFTILSGAPTILKDKITIKNTGNTPELWNALTNNTPQWKIKGDASFNLSSITAGGEKEITFEFYRNL